MNNRFTSKFKVRIRNPESSGGKIMTVEESSQLLFRGVFVFSFILAEIHGTDNGRRRDQSASRYVGKVISRFKLQVGPCTWSLGKYGG